MDLSEYLNFQSWVGSPERKEIEEEFGNGVTRVKEKVKWLQETHHTPRNLDQSSFQTTTLKLKKGEALRVKSGQKMTGLCFALVDSFGQVVK